MKDFSKKYQLLVSIGKLKKGTVIELKGCVYVSQDAAFDALSVWNNPQIFAKTND